MLDGKMHAGPGVGARGRGRIGNAWVKRHSIELGKMVRVHPTNGWASGFLNFSERTSGIASLSLCGEEASQNDDSP